MLTHRVRASGLVPERLPITAVDAEMCARLSRAVRDPILWETVTIKRIRDGAFLGYDRLMIGGLAGSRGRGQGT